MVPGLYMAATGLDTAEKNQEIIARNLAHIDVPGYRRQSLAFETFENALDAQGQPVPAGTQIAGISTDFKPGIINPTSRNLDVAIRGDGFFVIESPDGPVYTRNGVFQVNGQGQLVTSSGMVVQGPVQIPPNTPYSKIAILPDGTVRAGDVTAGKLQIVDFEDRKVLTTVGTSLFAAPEDADPIASNSIVTQGAREASNVVAVDELVRMIAGLRQYEAAQRVLKAIDDSIEQTTTPQSGA